MIASAPNAKVAPSPSEFFGRAKESYYGQQHAKISNRYRAAKQDRNNSRAGDFNGTHTNEDQHYASELDYFRMVEIGRALDRDDVLAPVGVTRLLDNVIQCGFSLDPKTPDKQANELIKLIWEAWSNDPESCDLQQEKTVHEMSRIAFRDTIVVGDVVLLPTNTGRLQFVENHRLRTPLGLPKDRAQMCVHGVLLDSDRVRQSYFITRDEIDPASFPKLKDVQEVKARNNAGLKNVWHLFHPKRMSATRGVTKFAGITNKLAMHDDVQYAKLVQQQMVSAFALVRERQMGFSLPGDLTEEGTYRAESPSTPGEMRTMRNVAAGMMYTTFPGEKLLGVSPNVPNPTFFDHCRQLQQLVAINLDLPVILLLLDASETNFSGWRGALEQAKISFRELQKWWAMTFYRRLYLWKMRQWSDPSSPFADPALVALRASGVDVFAHEWIHPTWPYIEPLKDASADLMEWGNGLNSMRRIQARNGRDWDVVATERMEDAYQYVTKAIETSERIKKEKDVEVPWQYFAPVPMSQGVTSQIDASEEEEPPPVAPGGFPPAKKAPTR